MADSTSKCREGPDDYSRCVDMEPSLEDSDYLTTTNYFDGVGKNCNNFSSQWHPGMVTDTNGVASSLCDFELYNTIAISPFDFLRVLAKLLKSTIDSLPHVDHQQPYKLIPGSNLDTTQYISTTNMNTSPLLVSSKRAFFACPERSGTSEGGKAVAPQAKGARKLKPCGNFSPKSWQNYAVEEFLLTNNSSLMPSNVFKVSAYLTYLPLLATSTTSVPCASATWDKMWTTAEVTASVRSTMTRPTKKLALQSLPNLSSSDCQNSKCSNDSLLSMKRACLSRTKEDLLVPQSYKLPTPANWQPKDLDSLLVMERMYNQDLPLCTLTVTTPHGWPCDIRTPYLPNSEHSRNGSQLTITGVNTHPSPAHGMMESQAESDPQGLQIPSNSRCAAKPWADTNLSRTEVKLLVLQSYKLPTPANWLLSDFDEHMSFGHHECMHHVFKQGSRERGPVKISLYLITYYIGNVKPMTSVLWNQSAVHNCDAVPAQSWHDDLKDQTMTPGVNETPASSNDCNATAGGASCEAPTLRPSSNAMRHLGTCEDSYQLLHKLNLVSLRTLFPTHHKGQGTSKCYHAVEYCCRLLGRQDPTLNGPMAQGATTTFSRKITTLMLLFPTHLLDT